MHKYKFRYLLFIWLLFVILFYKCEDEDYGYVDEGGFEITGVVLDSSLQLPIQDVIVGFTHHPDSIVVTGDSIYIGYFYLLSQANDLGKFRISEIGGISIQDFQEMLAWKKGYKLWRYADEPVPIDEIKDNSYELTIYLSKK